MLAIGPMDPTAKLDAQDPDVAGRLTGRYGVHNNARRLIDRMAAMYEDLRPKLALPRDEGRTEVLRENLELVADAIELAEGSRLLSADVRGLDKEHRCITFLVEFESGRTQRGWIAYTNEAFEGVEDDFQEKESLSLRLPASEDTQALREEVARLRAERETLATERAAGAVPLISQPGGGAHEASGYPRPDGDQSAEQLAEAQSEADRLREQVAAIAEYLPQPLDGYDDLNSEKSEAAYEGADDEGKKRILIYELTHKNRAWAQRAAEESPEGSGDGGGSSES